MAIGYIPPPTAEELEAEKKAKALQENPEGQSGTWHAPAMQDIVRAAPSAIRIGSGFIGGAGVTGAAAGGIGELLAQMLENGWDTDKYSGKKILAETGVGFVGGKAASSLSKAVKLGRGASAAIQGAVINAAAPVIRHGIEDTDKPILERVNPMNYPGEVAQSAAIGGATAGVLGHYMGKRAAKAERVPTGDPTIPMSIDNSDIEVPVGTISKKRLATETRRPTGQTLGGQLPTDRPAPIVKEAQVKAVAGSTPDVGFAKDIDKSIYQSDAISKAQRTVNEKSAKASVRREKAKGAWSPEIQRELDEKAPILDLIEAGKQRPLTVQEQVIINSEVGKYPKGVVAQALGSKPTQNTAQAAAKAEGQADTLLTKERMDATRTNEKIDKATLAANEKQMAADKVKERLQKQLDAGGTVKESPVRGSASTKIDGENVSAGWRVEPPPPPDTNGGGSLDVTDDLTFDPTPTGPTASSNQIATPIFRSKPINEFPRGGPNLPPVPIAPKMPPRKGPGGPASANGIFPGETVVTPEMAKDLNLPSSSVSQAQDAARAAEREAFNGPINKIMTQGTANPDVPGSPIVDDSGRVITGKNGYAGPERRKTGARTEEADATYSIAREAVAKKNAEAASAKDKGKPVKSTTPPVAAKATVPTAKSAPIPKGKPQPTAPPVQDTSQMTEAQMKAYYKARAPFEDIDWAGRNASPEVKAKIEALPRKRENIPVANTLRREDLLAAEQAANRPQLGGDRWNQTSKYNYDPTEVPTSRIDEVLQRMNQGPEGLTPPPTPKVPEPPTTLTPEANAVPVEATPANPLEAAQQKYGNLKDTKRAGVTKAMEAILADADNATVSDLASKVNKVSPLEGELRAAGAEIGRIKRGAPEVPNAPSQSAVPIQPTNPLDELSKLSPEQLDALPEDQWQKALTDIMNRSKGEKGAMTPEMASRLALGSLGAVTGAGMDEENRLRGAAIGAAAGAATPTLALKAIENLKDFNNPIAVGETAKKVQEALKTTIAIVPDLYRSKLLLQLPNLPINAWVGPWGSAVMRSAENAIEEALVGRKGWGVDALETLFTTNDFLRGWYKELPEAGSKIEQINSRADYSHALDRLPDKLRQAISFPGTAMTAGDMSARNILMNAGAPEHVARAATLTDEASMGLPRAINAFGRGGQTEGGIKSIPAKMMLPFHKTIANQVEGGLERFPGTGILSNMDRERFGVGWKDAKDRDPWNAQVAQQLLGSGVGLAAYNLGKMAPLGVTDKGTLTQNLLAVKLLSNVGGQYGAIAALAFAAGQATQLGKDPIDTFLAGAAQAMPLPSGGLVQDARQLYRDANNPEVTTGEMAKKTLLPKIATEPLGQDEMNEMLRLLGLR